MKKSLKITSLVGVLLVISSSVFSQQKLVGRVFGHKGAWEYAPTATVDKAFDGDIRTYVDPGENGNYMGYDFGDSLVQITSIKYYPRESHPFRMIDGIFIGTNDTSAIGTGGDILFTVVDTPAVAQVMTEVQISSDKWYQFVYFYKDYTNVAEIEFYGNIKGNPAGISDINTDELFSVELMGDNVTILSDKVQQFDIYSLAGQLLSTELANRSFSCEPGMYIVRNKESGLSQKFIIE